MIASGSTADPFLFKEYVAQNELGNSDIRGKTEQSSIIADIPNTKSIIIMGQSNMSTSIGTTTYTTLSASAQNLSIYDGAIYNGSDPVLGANIGGASISSVCMAIADSMITRSKATRCIVVPIAMGGTPFAAWAPATANTLFGRLTTAIYRLRARGLEPDAIFCGMGETDNTLATSAASITASINATVDGIRAAPVSCNTKFYVGKYTMVSGAVSATVQTGIANSIDNPGRKIFVGFDADVNCTVAGGFRLGDQTHLSNTGRATSATGWTTVAFP